MFHGSGKCHGLPFDIDDMMDYVRNCPWWDS